MATNIPGYPVVYVTVSTDGSAHVNVAGRHVDFPANDPERTRVGVLAYAVQVAKDLGRGVRVHSSEPEGSYDLGVYPGGEVEILDSPVPRAKPGPAAQPIALPRTSGLGVGAPPPVAPAAPRVLPPVPVPVALPVHAPAVAPLTPAPPAPEAVDSTVFIHRPTAVLTFSTGDVVQIGKPAIIGRKPTRTDTDWPGAQLVSIADPERKVSRVHCAIAWRAGHLVVTDRGSTNGIAITRGSAERRLLDVDASVELFDGDVLHLGTNVDVTITVAVLERGAVR